MFENIYDVLTFLTNHCATGFQSADERQQALDVIAAENPLTGTRKAAQEARIAAERAKDTGVAATPVAAAAPAYTQAELDAAVQAAVARLVAANPAGFTQAGH
jgi:hypothetical protein